MQNDLVYNKLLASPFDTKDSKPKACSYAEYFTMFVDANTGDWRWNVSAFTVTSSPSSRRRGSAAVPLCAAAPEIRARNTPTLRKDTPSKFASWPDVKPDSICLNTKVGDIRYMYGIVTNWPYRFTLFWWPWMTFKGLFNVFGSLLIKGVTITCW